MSLGVHAQRQYFMRDHRKTSFINNVELGVGLYTPNMDNLNQYWSVLDENTAGNDVGSLDGGLKVDLGVFAHLYMDGYIGIFGGYYTDNTSASGTSFVGTQVEETLTYSAIPIGVKFVHEFHLGDPFLHRPRAAELLLIHPYLGLGTTFWNMTQDYERLETGATAVSGSEGTMYQTITGIVGVKYTLAKFLDLGIEYNYEAGSYQQYFQASPNIALGGDGVEDVNVNGHTISVKLSYLINSRVEWRYVQKVKRFR